MAEKGRWPLVALLLEPLRAHRPEEAVGSQRNMSSARSCRWATMTQAACHTYAASPSRRCGL